MQPEHIQENSNSAAPLEDRVNNSKTLSQHGILPDPEAGTARPLPSRGSDASCGGLQCDRDSSGGAELSHVQIHTTTCDSRTSSPEKERLEDPQTPARRRLVDRISEYEAMGHSSSLVGRETGFIVKKTDWTGREDSPISKFPNEILTHALSFLDPLSMLNATLISRRFYDLLRSEATWRTAFTKHFPSASDLPTACYAHESSALSASQDRRYFTCLSASTNGNAWKKEYIMRAFLLRSLTRGKRAATVNSAPQGHTQGTNVITYLPLTGPISVTHLAAKFGPKAPRLVHGSSSTGIITASSPATGKLEPYPSRELARMGQRPNLQQARLGHPGHDLATDMGVDAVMDISEENGWVYGENFPDGNCYIHPHSSPYTTEYNAGRFVEFSEADGQNSCYTAVWIARKKHTGIVETTKGKVWVITGNSRGVVSFFEMAYANNRLARPKRFYVSPGVPIVQIKVDDDYSIKRKKAKAPWIVIINALGEVYYLREDLGAANYFQIIPQTRRKPTHESEVFLPGYDAYLQARKHNSHSASQNLQLMVINYSKVKYIWEDWNLRWFVDVDWVGFNVMVGKKVQGDKPVLHGDREAKAELKRYSTVSKTKDNVDGDFVAEIISDSAQEARKNEQMSIFGGFTTTVVGEQSDSAQGKHPETADECVVTDFTFGGQVTGAITATAMDMSTLAALPDEDLTPESVLPGGNARLYAVGTTIGSVFIWNVRPSPVCRAGQGGGGSNEIEPEHPQRVIHTSSPQISTLALSSLYLVHGGNDGLVQFWDPLASTAGPIRTLHQKLAQRARRRMGQAEGDLENLVEEFPGDNQFAARCLVLDSDATSLKGVVALGTHIRYWNFPALGGDYGSKKKKRPSWRKQWNDTSPAARARGEIRSVISDETKIHREEARRRKKEQEEMEARYGISMGRAALSEEEMIQYAIMISQETYEKEIRP